MASQDGMPQAAPNGPPYLPTTWLAGGPPVKKVDIPAQSVFMVLFLIGAIVHMKIFLGNKRRGHTFLPSSFIFVFCVSRILTSILRIASISLPQNIHLALAAQIFLAAGILILFIVNIVFAIRLVRSTHRSFGWHPAFGTAFKLLFVVIGATLVMLIAGTIQSFYTLDPQILASDRSLQLYGSTVLAIVATLPLPMAALTLLIPYSPLDEFGAGRLRTKVIVLLISTTLLSVGAWYRCAIVRQPPVPRSQPLPGYLAKGPFYILNFLIELQTVIMYAILRVDQRYHIPNGAKGPGSYSRAQPHGDVEMQDSRPTSAASSIAKRSTSIHEKEHRATVEIVTRVEIKDTSRLLAVPLPSRATSSRRTSSQRLQNLLTKQPTSSLKKQWRASEESRIVRRLGGPWSQLPSPAESTFSLDAPSFNLDTPTFSFDAHSTISQATRIDVRTGRSVSCAAPSIRDTLRGGDGVDWTPEIEWELASPRRFLSLKKKSLKMLK